MTASRRRSESTFLWLAVVTFMQKRPMGLEIEAPTPDEYEKGAGRLEGCTA